MIDLMRYGVHYLFSMKTKIFLSIVLLGSTTSMLSIAAPNECVPGSAVICSISQETWTPNEQIRYNGQYTVSTTIQNVQVFYYTDDSASAHAKAVALANQLHTAGVCKTVVDTSN